jgi:trans-2,3-dihydro-3-hydroxyanthranilate isomerase
VLSWDDATATAYARVFAGDLHWDEDPATGSAALGTGVWLVGTGLLPADGTSSYVVRQGEKLGRPSLLTCTVTASGGVASSATVQGAVVPIASGRIRVPA